MLKTQEQRMEEVYRNIQKRIGKKRTGAWHHINKKDVALFAKATRNKQFIHTNPNKSAKLSPYKCLIAHAYLVLSLIPHLLNSLHPPLGGSKHPPVVLNYGFNRVRFLKGVPIGARVRATRILIDAKRVKKNAILIPSLINY